MSQDTSTENHSSLLLAVVNRVINRTIAKKLNFSNNYLAM